MENEYLKEEIERKVHAVNSDGSGTIPPHLWEKPDMVNHPPHYTRGKIEHIDVIDAFFKENYYLGQVFKYTMRAGHKGNEIEDLEKAKWYLDRYIKIKKGEL